MRLALVCSALFVVACAPRNAIVGGRQVPRVTLDYSDHRVFALTHDAAYPVARGPSSGLHEYAGRMTGRVCGNDVWLEAEYRGRYMELAGFYEPNDGARHTINQMQLEVRDYAGERHLRGAIGAGQLPVIGWAGRLAGSAGHGAGQTIGDYAADNGDHVIDLSYNSGGLHGWLNGRRFALHSDGDDALVGTVTVGGNSRPFTLPHASILWAMPASDQAAVLPMLLSCNLEGRSGLPADAHLELTTTLSMSDPRMAR